VVISTIGTYTLVEMNNPFSRTFADFAAHLFVFVFNRVDLFENKYYSFLNEHMLNFN